VVGAQSENKGFLVEVVKHVVKPMVDLVVKLVVEFVVQSFMVQPFVV